MKRPPQKPSQPAGPEKIDIGQWNDEPKPVRRTFPGPRNAGVPLRVALERRAYADVAAHARESLDAEICGVLAGDVCEDDEGLFVHIQVAVRGSSARESNARVTFTQETWNAVHKTLEREHPKLRILGWYHSHPGFGVEFSEMDVFIQKNFFASPTQVALLIDPLGGDTAMCRNAEEGVDYFDRFWVDGREHTLRVPGPPRGGGTGGGGAAAGVPAETIANIEVRLGQLIQAVDEQRTYFYRFLLALFIVALMGIAGWVGFGIYSSYTSRLQPPQLNSYIPIPVRVGDKTMTIGVGIVDWEVPPELNAIDLQLAEQKQAEASKAAASASPAAQPSASPAASPSH